MAENKEYFSKEVENGSIQISEEVVASVAAITVQSGLPGTSLHLCP